MSLVTLLRRSARLRYSGGCVVATLLCLPVGIGSAQVPPAPGNISAIWANEGGDKVTQDELRASTGVENKTGTVLNRTWNGSSITLFGARNESVSFNLVLEAASIAAPGVSVAFDTLTGPGGAVIQTTAPATGSGVFTWVNRPIELFYTRYLQIKGLSEFGWYRGDERQLPVRFQRPTLAGGWADRPDHDKFYPDILVPLELVPTFNIAQGQNESIWCDIYIPKGTPAGLYTGTVSISEGGVVTRSVPVSLEVKPFSLPDTPSVKGFANLDATDISWRYASGPGGYVNWNSDEGRRVKHISDVYYQLFHRHRIDLVAGETEVPAFVPGIHPFFTPRYDGSLYTPENGYDGPGVGVGNTLYAIGMYGTWGRNIFSEQAMWDFANPIGDWFASHFPSLQYFIYLEDEPSPDRYPIIENWAKWLAEDPGNGHNMLSMATVSLAVANAFIPDLSIPTSASHLGDCPVDSPNSCDNTAFTANALAASRARGNQYYWRYGGDHPGSGTSNTEDDGIGMRTLPWVQSKLTIDRWFIWFANLNAQDVDWFQRACSWGCDSAPDPLFGEVSNHAYTNGTGVLVYPGTDLSHPQDSYGVDGPFASLRLKEWRRGTEDGDYLALSRQIDPAATAAILARVMPAAVWENHAPGWPNGDPSFFLGPVSWSSNPDDWEAARAELAAIISTACIAGPTAQYCQ